MVTSLGDNLRGSRVLFRPFGNEGEGDRDIANRNVETEVGDTRKKAERGATDANDG